jgi:hypothetical protein
MLAEIFFLRLETMLRASEVADRAKNSRFVPLFGLGVGHCRIRAGLALGSRVKPKAD